MLYPISLTSATGTYTRGHSLGDMIIIAKSTVHLQTEVPGRRRWSNLPSKEGGIKISGHPQKHLMCAQHQHLGVLSYEKAVVAASACNFFYILVDLLYHVTSLSNWERKM